MTTGNDMITEGIGALSRYLDPAVLRETALAVGVFLATYLAINLLIWAFNRAAKGMAAHTKTQIDDAVLAALQTPLKGAALIFSIYLAFSFVIPDSSVTGKGLNDLLFIAILFIAAFGISRVLNALIKWYGKEMAPTGKGRVKDVFPIVRKIIGISLYLTALVIVLDHFGVQIAPLIAGLGIAGLAVALALQDTLANFFAGVYILADKPVRIGDYVRLDDGTEGYVEEVGWRSTRIRLLTENSLILPNSALAQQKIVNYYTPTGLITSVSVGAAYDSDPEKVERVLLETADTVVEKAPGTVKSFKPVVRLVGLGDFALEYKVQFQVEKFTDQIPVSHLMRKEILKAFRKERIEIPFPTRTIFTKKA